LSIKPKYLIYFEHYSNVNQAIDREKQLKKWSRKNKEWLISTTNPDWNFLNDDFLGD
jgi:putative endonuclease